VFRGRRKRVWVELGGSVVLEEVEDKTDPRITKKRGGRGGDLKRSILHRGWVVRVGYLQSRRIGLWKKEKGR